MRIVLCVLLVCCVTWKLTAGARSTKMHYAAQNGNLRLVRDLMKAHPHLSDRRARDPRGRTALHLAAEAGHAKVVRLLLKEYFLWDEVSLKDDDGNTPLALAYINDHADVVKEFRAANVREEL